MGVMWRWFDIFLNNQTDVMKYYFKQGAETDLFKPLSLADFQGAFCVLAIGLTLSTIVFILELIFYWLTKKGKQESEAGNAVPAEEDPPFPFTL